MVGTPIIGQLGTFKVPCYPLIGSPPVSQLPSMGQEFKLRDCTEKSLWKNLSIANRTLDLLLSSRAHVTTRPSRQSYII